MKLSELPWRFYRNVYYKLRKYLFTMDAGEYNLVLLDTTTEEFKKILRKEHFGNGKLFSYRYEGEDLNMYRPEYEDDEWEDYQTHVRAFKINTGKGTQYCGVKPHHELDPRSSGQARPHLNGVNMSTRKGIENVVSILDRYEVKYRVR